MGMSKRRHQQLQWLSSGVPSKTKKKRLGLEPTKPYRRAFWEADSWRPWGQIEATRDIRKVVRKSYGRTRTKFAAALLDWFSLCFPNEYFGWESVGKECFSMHSRSPYRCLNSCSSCCVVQQLAHLADNIGASYLANKLNGGQSVGELSSRKPLVKLFGGLFKCE